MASNRLARAFLSVNERVWRRLPARARASRPVRVYGGFLHSMVSRHADREMYFGTQFLRNRPALDLMRQLAERKPRGSTLNVAVLGCSIGAEVYSILWTLRPARPDLEIVVHAVDIAPDVLEYAKRGVYGPETSELVHATIFERLSPRELEEMFDWDGELGRVKPWLREGIVWQVGDAGDHGLADELGPQDLVVASNFLCHMDAEDAERCLRNFSRLVREGAYVFVSGVDLDVRTSVARELGWRPIPELRAEIHDGDPLVRADWPWRWWGLEPLDPRKPDWELRYATVFQV